jgi:two-component system nitrate/nitrite response regulator NarL
MIVRLTNYSPLAAEQRRRKANGVGNGESGNGAYQAENFATAVAEASPSAEQGEPVAQIASVYKYFRRNGAPRDLDIRTESFGLKGSVARQSSVTVLVCAHALLREGLRRILSAAHFSVVATAARVDDVMASLLAEERLILLILEVGGDQNATVAQIKLFREQHPTARVALLADGNHLSDANIIAAFRSGADAYFLNPSSEAFVKSLELVMLGATILPPAILSFFLRQQSEAAESEVEMGADVQRGPIALTEASLTTNLRFSARERSVLRGLIEGNSNKTIARKYEIAEATVKVHVKSILRKIRVNNRTQAAIWAMNNDTSIGEPGNSSPAGSDRPPLADPG